MKSSQKGDSTIMTVFKKTELLVLVHHCMKSANLWLIEGPLSPLLLFGASNE